MDVNNPLKMVLIGIDPYPYLYLYGIYYYHCHLWFHMTHTPRPDWSPGRQPVMQDWLLMALLRRYVRDSPFGMWSNGLHWEYHNETVVSFFSVAPQFCWYAKQQNINAFSVFNSTVTLRRHIWMSFSCVSYLSRNLWFTLLSSLHFQTTPWISSRFDNFSNIYLEVIHSDSLCHLYNR